MQKARTVANLPESTILLDDFLSSGRAGLRMRAQTSSLYLFPMVIKHWKRSNFIGSLY
jgi:hypothetical protein